MAGLGIGIALLGYSVFYYGLSQVQGYNYGLLDLVNPKRWQKVNGTIPKDEPTVVNPGKQINGQSQQDLQKAADKLTADANAKSNPLAPINNPSVSP